MEHTQNTQEERHSWMEEKAQEGLVCGGSRAARTGRGGAGGASIGLFRGLRVALCSLSLVWRTGRGTRRGRLGYWGGGGERVHQWRTQQVCRLGMLDDDGKEDKESKRRARRRGIKRAGPFAAPLRPPTPTQSRARGSRREEGRRRMAERRAAKGTRQREKGRERESRDGGAWHGDEVVVVAVMTGGQLDVGRCV